MKIDLKVKTIELSMKSDQVSRFLIDNKETNEELLDHEGLLRRKAYLETALYFDDTLFDDSDMNGTYYLTVVYDDLTKTPLLSSRYYYNLDIIKNHLHGDMYFQHGWGFLEEKLDFEKLNKNKLFMADRLAGNYDNALYKSYHQMIFELYHKEIYTLNANSTILLLVRLHDSKQLQKYNKLGFSSLGITPYHGIPHGVLMLDMSTVSNPFSVIEQAS